MDLIEPIVAQVPMLQSLRRDIHAHPELGFEEAAHRGSRSPARWASGVFRCTAGWARPASSAS